MARAGRKFPNCLAAGPPIRSTNLIWIMASWCCSPLQLAMTTAAPRFYLVMVRTGKKIRNRKGRPIAEGGLAYAYAYATP
jgi:hypothetical protein